MTSQERRVIDGKPYDREVSIFYPSDLIGKLYCECGSNEFHVIYSGLYETTAECAKRGRSEVVHSG